MLAAPQPGVIKKFHRTPWRFQQTFHTPLQNLAAFTATILDSLDQVDSGTVMIDSVIMEAKKLEALLLSHQLQHDLRHDSSIIAQTSAEVQPLLLAALGDGVDFLFVPTPKPFVLYADHDEYSQRPLFSVGLRDVDPPQGLRSISATLQRPDGLEFGRRSAPGDPAHSRGVLTLILRQTFHGQGLAGKRVGQQPLQSFHLAPAAFPCRLYDTRLQPPDVASALAPVNPVPM